MLLYSLKSIKLGGLEKHLGVRKMLTDRLYKGGCGEWVANVVMAMAME